MGAQQSTYSRAVASLKTVRETHDDLGYAEGGALPQDDQ